MLAIIVKTTDEKNKKIKFCFSNSYFLFAYPCTQSQSHYRIKNDLLIQFNTKFGDKSMTTFNFTRKDLWNKHAVTEENASTNESVENLLVMNL